MKGIPARFSPFLALAALLSTGLARADYINWSYQWSVSPGEIIRSFDSSVRLLPLYGYRGFDSISVALITPVRFPPSTPPVDSTRADFTLHLTDLSTQQTGTLTFTGFFVDSGKPAPALVFPDSPGQTFTLGKHRYTVAIEQRSYQTPWSGPGVAWIDAEIMASVRVADVAQHAPEPASLVLGGTAFAFATMVAWRRRTSREMWRAEP